MSLSDWPVGKSMGEFSSLMLDVGGLHFSLFMLGVGLTEDKQAPTPPHHVAVSTAFLDDTLGFEAQ